MSAPTGYTRRQIALHWITLVLVVLQIVFHEGMAGAWEIAVDTNTYAFSTPVILHFAVGTLILGIALWRLLLRAEHGAPPAPEGEAKPLVLLSKLTHVGLYALMILLPVSGAVAWGMQIEAPAEAHEVMKFLLIALVALHFIGAVYHRFVLKSGVMERMIRPVD